MLGAKTLGSRVEIRPLFGKIVVFAVPGAFTPGCSKTHLPGYGAKSEEMKRQGISKTVCVFVNDPFVMGAWAKDQKTSGKVRLLADPSAALAKALDLTVDIAPLGGVSTYLTFIL